MTQALLKSLSLEDFKKIIETPDRACLAVIGAPWCGSYHMISKQVSELEAEFSHKLCIHRINADGSPELMQHYGLSRPPALLFFDRGLLRDKLLETAPKQVIRDKIIRMLW